MGVRSMKVSSSIAVTVTALALGATTAAFAVPAPSNPGTGNMPTTAPPSNDGTANMPSTTPTQAPSTVPPDNQGTANKPSDTGKPSDLPGPHATLPAKAKAYGKYCQDQSKKHVAGTPGTPFSQCVTAMAKAAHTSAPTDTSAQIKSAARSACKGMSHKGAKKGSAFSQCVSGAAKLLKNQNAQNS
jgi:hypothetical protein